MLSVVQSEVAWCRSFLCIVKATARRRRNEGNCCRMRHLAIMVIKYTHWLGWQYIHILKIYTHLAIMVIEYIHSQTWMAGQDEKTNKYWNHLISCFFLLQAIWHCIRAPPKRGGKSWNLKGEEDILPNTSWVWWSTDILSSAILPYGVDQDIPPAGAICVDSVKFNPYLLMMKECQSYQSRGRLKAYSQNPKIAASYSTTAPSAPCHRRSGPFLLNLYFSDLVNRICPDQLSSYCLTAIFLFQGQ